MWQAVAAAAVAAAMRKLQRRGAIHGWMQSASQDIDPEKMANPMYEANIDPHVGVGAGQSGLIGDFIKGLAMNVMGAKLGNFMEASAAQTGQLGSAGAGGAVSGVEVADIPAKDMALANARNSMIGFMENLGFSPATANATWTMGVNAGNHFTNGWAGFVENYLNNLKQKKGTMQ